MRILFADHLGTVVGGAQTYERAVMAALERRGHQVALLHACRVAVGDAAIDAECRSSVRWCVEDSGQDAVVKSALEWSPDVIYDQGLETDLENALLGRKRTVLYAHNYYGTCATGNKYTLRPTARPCERVFGPACLALNFSLGCGLRNPRALVRSYRAQTIRRDNLERFDAVLVASRWMEAEYVRHGVPPSRLHRVPYFSAAAAEAPAPPVERSQSGRVLFAGRLTLIKGGTLLVDALALAREMLGRSLTLVVVGDGPDRENIEERARRKSVPVELAGWLDSKGVAASMRSADVLAVPSVWPEPFGIVGIEAGALGLPSVAFATGGITDWLRPGESGELADASPPTAEGLAGALVRALGDRAHWQKLRLGASRVAAEYTIDAHVERLEGILGNVATRSKQDERPVPSAKTA
jgi:glycosyltransferase involved in cell wall biosynthesis